MWVSDGLERPRPLSYYALSAAVAAGLAVLSLGLITDTEDAVVTGLFVFFLVLGAVHFVWNEYQRWRNGR